MRNFSYSDIIYVGSNKPLICRDGNKQYSDSMDLLFTTYDNLKSISNNKCIILDISVGWTTDLDMDIIESYLNSRSNTSNIYIRLVDQFSHQWNNSDIYIRMARLSIDKGIQIIGTYNVNYYGLDVGLVLPYPYLESEVRDFNLDKFDSRNNKLILTGSDIPDIYPMRKSLYDISESSNFIDTIRHPGYSGNHWNEGIIGNKFIDKLSQYKFMACTTCIEDYELLKYIECAEAGCIPVGELPSSLMNSEVSKYFIRIPNNSLTSKDEFDEWFNDKIKSLDSSLKTISIKYRSLIKLLRGKNYLKNKLLNYINR